MFNSLYKLSSLFFVPMFPRTTVVLAWGIMVLTLPALLLQDY